MPEPAARLLPQWLTRRIDERDVPEPVYAVVGAWVALDRADLPAAAWRAAVHTPVAAARVPGALLDRAGAALGAAGGTVRLLADSTAAARGAAAAAYRELSADGRDAVVAYAAERSIRARVSQMEDRIAPTAGRAAVRVVEQQRRLQESARVQRAAQTARRTRDAARRGRRRFAELNAPVLAADAD